MSAGVAMPCCAASAASFTSMATVRMTTSPAVSSMRETASPAACSAPTAASTLDGVQVVAAAIATRFDFA